MYNKEGLKKKSISTSYYGKGEDRGQGVPLVVFILVFIKLSGKSKVHLKHLIICRILFTIIILILSWPCL